MNVLLSCYFGFVGVKIGYDEGDVCCMYVGSDFFFMLFWFEFCGLS